jgi:hypothetical protein
MWQASCAIADSLAGIRIETSRHAVSGTGLVNGTVDWVAETQLILAAEKPNTKFAPLTRACTGVSPSPIALSVLVHAARLFDGYRQIPGDHTLDSGRVLAGPGNRPIGTKEACGQPRRLRSVFDGVHLSVDDARISGEQIAHTSAPSSDFSQARNLADRVGMARSARPGAAPRRAE